MTSSPEPIVLVHAGIADNRMWDPLEPLLDVPGPIHRHELRGYGSTPLGSGRFSHVADLEASCTVPSVLIGASFGGLVALELAGRRPDLVAALVLIDAPLPDHAFSAETEAYWAEEERLVDAGELDAAAELNVRFWVGAAEPEVAALVTAMTRRSFELQCGPAAADAEEIEGDPIELGRIEAPALVLAGELDRPDFLAIAQRLATELPDNRLEMIEGAGHLPALERPEATARAINRFLAQPPR